MVQRMAWPDAASLRRKRTRFQALCPSNPDVGLKPILSMTATVESAGYLLVQEEQELRLAGKLDTNRGTFAVFNPQRADDGVGIGLQATHLQALFNTGGNDQLQLFRVLRTGWTHYATFSESGTEAGCLSRAENRSASRTVVVG